MAEAAPADRGRIWSRWFTSEGKQFVAGGVVSGQDGIAALMGPAFEVPGYSLVWDPDQGDISDDGTLGWTSGRYQSTEPGPEGAPVVKEGRYLTIWKREEDGAWKASLDTGIPD